jgi:carbonic anhydrase
VIRVAGNIVAPSQIGSIEFATERFGVRLVVVMGHSGCGAVLASLEAPERPGNDRSPNLGFIDNRIKSNLEPMLEQGTEQDCDALLNSAVKENIRASADQLRNGSRILEKLIRDEGLAVVGAEYSLATGEVGFLDGAIESVAAGNRS